MFVSAPVGIKPIRYYDSDFKFSGFDFNWPEIKSKAQNFKVYHSNNDPYISMKNGEELSRQLAVNLTFISNAGHLNAEAGYTKFDILLNDINNVIYPKSHSAQALVDLAKMAEKLPHKSGEPTDVSKNLDHYAWGAEKDK